ncbi:hypothetical protein D0862_02795 [Hortaea werneckii]|uniref:Uncharacterized protein n=1 Tax=Hortaea werneckii TaxID=91943 RepID=A0A3M7HGD3_HORWE|nr:hypothetical protein D0862_02795 [Hortaea werneckii]
MRPTQLLRSGGGKIPYPKHVWSPAGGWYAQPANWKQNTAVMGAVVPDRFFPSRYWSREIREHERGLKTSA